MKRIIITISLLASALVSQAQTSGVESLAMPFSRLPKTASSLAMGATPTVYDPSSFVLSGKDFSSELSYFGLKSDIPSNNLGVNLAYGLTDRLALTVDGIMSMGAEIDGIKSSDMAFGAGAAFAITRNISIGLSGRYLTSSIGEDVSYSAFNADIMMGARFDDFNAGFGIRGLGSKVADSPLPCSLSADLGYRLGFAVKNAVDFKLAADYYFCNALAFGAGAQYSWNEMVFARVGYHKGAVLPDFLSMGCGFAVKGFALDFTYLLSSPTIGSSAMLGIGFSF